MRFLDKIFRRSCSVNFPGLSDNQKRQLLDFDLIALRTWRAAKEAGIKTTIVVSGAPQAAIDLLKKISIKDIQVLEKIRSMSDKADQLDHPNDIELYKKIIKIAPWDSISVLSIASSYFNIGDHKNANTWMKKAADIDPNNTRIRRNLERIRLSI